MNSVDRKLVEVYVAADEIEARLIEQLLAEHHIKCGVVGTGLMGGAGELPPGWIISPRIWVDEEYQESARKILQRWEQERAETRSQTKRDWQCASCLAQVPSGFEVCWQCQSER